MADPVPDLPAGIGSAAGSDAPVRYTQRDVAGARAVLAQARAEQPARLLSLTDEQLLGLDGYARPRFAATPWLEDHPEPERQRFAASVALRTLIAAEQVGLVADAETGRQQWSAAGDLSGVLVLRRTAQTFLTGERTVHTLAGPQSHRLHYYLHPDGALEEEVTAFGVHHFTPVPIDRVPQRMTVLLDPDGIAAAPAQEDGGADGGAPAVTVTTSALPTSPVGARLAETRAASVLTAVRTADSAVRQVSVYVTDDEVLVIEPLDPAQEDPELRIRAVDREALHRLITELAAS